ncbi:MAG: hypothetical protein KDH15_02045 [Rhodocyclaceae bacterium]|nr:hypothetical protein [Rhodocyclaceae bacterium]
MSNQDPRFDHLLNGLSGPAQAGGWLQKIGAVIATLVVFGLALTFSVVLFAVVASIGLLVWGYLWWKTRDLRKAMREHAAHGRPGTAGPGGQATGAGEILEGEVIREVPDDEARRDGR